MVYWCCRSGATGKHLVEWREGRMESFDNFEIIGKKNFEREIGRRSENLATLPNGKKKISWERVVPDKKELVEEQAGAGGEKDQEQGVRRQDSFEASEQQKPQV